MDSSTSVTLPRDFRFNAEVSLPEAPIKLELQTASPAQLELQTPSPQRARLRVKRRNVSNVSRPTEQFLASVAAADVPVPTIEVGEDEQMPDQTSGLLPNFHNLEYLAPRSRSYHSPHTPIPNMLNLGEEKSCARGDWYMDSDFAFNDAADRPFSSLSNLSDCSDDSFFSTGPISRPSEDSNCTSPDADALDPFVDRPAHKVHGTNAMFGITYHPGSSKVISGRVQRKPRADVPWSKEMTDHLWNTFQKYLEDPTVTPFRMTTNPVPPEGIVHRVARGARRSWKGPKLTPVSPLAKEFCASLNADTIMNVVQDAALPDPATSKSGSITPTPGTAATKILLPWYHTDAATRSHFRDLCKRDHIAVIDKCRRMHSTSPAPIKHTRTRIRVNDVADRRNPFSTADVAFSLMTSSSQSMHADGPLSKLTKTPPRKIEQVNMPSQSTHTDALFYNSTEATARTEEVPMRNELLRRQLGSPFGARTYGPSSSNAFSSLSKASPERAQPGTVAATGPYLRSPLRFDQPRSLTGTQKRRAQHPLEDELSPRGGVIRPSILDEQLFGSALASQQRRVRVRSRGFSLGDETLIGNMPDPFTDSSPANNSTANSASGSTRFLLPSAEFGPARRYPSTPVMTDSGTSNTFPARFPQPALESGTVRRRHVATVHHSRHSIESFDFGDGPSLQSRLTRLDGRIAEIRNREAAGRQQ